MTPYPYEGEETRVSSGVGRLGSNECVSSNLIPSPQDMPCSTFPQRFSQSIMHTMYDLDGESLTEMLPALQNLFLEQLESLEHVRVASQ